MSNLVLTNTLAARITACAMGVLFILPQSSVHAMPDFMLGQTAAPQTQAVQQIQIQPTAPNPLQQRAFTVNAVPFNQIEPAAAPIALPKPQQAAPISLPTPQATQNTNSAPIYRLGAGDKLRMIVFGEEELSAEYELDGTGNLSLPLIGQVRAGGQTAQNLENQIKSLYADGYLVNPRISLEVINFRPFYIVGEVNNPGNYPYISGLTVLNAVAVAGGYSPRAKKNKIELKRIQNGKEHLQIVTEASQVLPGDVIEIKERFF